MVLKLRYITIVAWVLVTIFLLYSIVYLHGIVLGVQNVEQKNFTQNINTEKIDRLDITDDFNGYTEKNTYERPVYDSGDGDIAYAFQDSSGDGFSDYESQLRDDLGVDEKNVLIQISYSESVDVDSIPFQKLAEEYAENEVELVIEIDEQPQVEQDKLTPDEYREIRDELWTKRADGYYHMAIVESVNRPDSNNNYLGFNLAGNNTGNIIQARQPSQKHTISTISHELAHDLTLDDEVFDGIDSREYSFEEYPSSLNYNQPIECGIIDETSAKGIDISLFDDRMIRCQQQPVVGYSSDGVFDDWDYIQNNIQNANCARLPADAYMYCR